MKRYLKSFPVLLATMICCGCNEPAATRQSNNAVKPAPGTHVHADGTVHANHSTPDQGHSHDNPPHGGTVLDWGGGKYHLEFVVDHTKQQVTVYVLGSNVKENLAVEAESIELALENPQVGFTLKADPLEGEPAGKSSRFVGTHPDLASPQKLAGTIHGVLSGTPYSGKFQQK